MGVTLSRDRAPEPGRARPARPEHADPSQSRARVAPGAALVLAVQRTNGNRAAHRLVTASTRRSVARMTIAEYDGVMDKQDPKGDAIAEILTQGWAARAGKGNADNENAWRAKQLETITRLLAPIDLKTFESDAKTQKAVQYVIGGLRSGRDIVPPPNLAALVKANAPLFRGTTIDDKTKAAYVGSAGSQKGGTPTSPGAVQAALFAIKGAAENSAEGVVLWGPITNVTQFGFA